jgi:aspartate 1-decarboxylase
MTEHNPVKTFVSAKLHRITVTDKSLDYIGSVAIDAHLLGLAGIAPYEQVHVVNLTNGARWVTYALPSPTAGCFSLNGGGARLGEIGDRCVVMTYRQEDEFSGADVVVLDDRNRVIETDRYENS